MGAASIETKPLFMVIPLSRSEAALPPPDSAEPLDLLVRRVQAGNRKAFEKLYRREVDRVYALCLRMTADPRRTAEIVQDVFVRAWERINTYRFEAPFGHWLSRLTVRMVLDARRTRSRWRNRFEATADWSSLDQPETTHPAGGGIDLERAIATLPEKARLVFVLHDVEGYRHAEIAELMHITVGTTKGQLHRARQLLRAALNA